MNREQKSSSKKEIKESSEDQKTRGDLSKSLDFFAALFWAKC